MAEHGKRTLFFDNRNKRKTVEMWSVEARDGTSVRAFLTPSLWYADEVMMASESFRMSWGKLMEEAWSAVDDSIPAQQTYHRAVLENAPANLKQGRQLTMMGVALIILFVALFAVGAYASLDGGILLLQELNYYALPLLLIGLLLLYFGLMKTRQAK